MSHVAGRVSVATHSTAARAAPTSASMAGVDVFGANGVETGQAGEIEQRIVRGVHDCWCQGVIGGVTRDSIGRA